MVLRRPLVGYERRLGKRIVLAETSSGEGAGVGSGGRSLRAGRRPLLVNRDRAISGHNPPMSAMRR
jgi:hypothetical protein